MMRSSEINRQPPLRLPPGRLVGWSIGGSKLVDPLSEYWDAQYRRIYGYIGEIKCPPHDNAP